MTGDVFRASNSSNVGFTVYRCEIHFERLPDNLKLVDLIEEKGQEFNRKRFNCFDIKLKTWREDIGSKKDSDKIVKDFEGNYKTNTKPKKTIVKKKPVLVKEKLIVEDKPVDVEEKPKLDEKTVVVEEKPKETDKYPSSSKRLHHKKDLVCEQLIILDRVKFHDNSTKFNGMIAANQTLYFLFNYMKEHPSSTLKLYGHSDVFGPEERNMELSKQRVIKIQRWLSMYGIKANRIDYEWFGPEKPLIKEGDVINRRVEVILNCKG